MAQANVKVEIVGLDALKECIAKLEEIRAEIGTLAEANAAATNGHRGDKR
jgi:hypothetical protein